MDLFEYQGKQFFATFGIPVSPGDVATTVDEAVDVAEGIGSYPVVVKAQVQVGGRGKAGGIKLANDADEVRTHASDILGMDIKGHTVERIWIEQASDIAEEYYASFTLDRSAKKHLGMLSAQGGVEIEAVAESDPDAIAKVWIDPVDGLTEDAARAWVAEAKLNPQATEGTVDILQKLYRAYVEGDADLVEINPLILTPGGQGPRPRRQGHPRRQLGVPPPRVRAVRGHAGARRARGGGPREGPAVRRARRHRRHHRQRRRARHVHRRHRQPGGRPAGQLPRHRRRRQRRGDGGRARGHQQRPEGAGHLHQHLRRHHQGRGGGERHRHRPRSGRHRLAHRDPPRRHQRRARAGRSSPTTSPSRLISKPTMLEAAEAVVELAGN